MNSKNYDPKIHHRNTIRLKGYDYSQPGAYFITICAYNRENTFGKIVNAKMESNIYGKIVFTHWHNLKRYYNDLELSAFTVMPNHVHGILVIKFAETGKRYLISDVVRSFKTFSSKRINELRKMSGTPVWQRNYWEHVIRDQNSFNRIHDYILINPLRWHLDKENLHHDGEDDFDRWLDSL